MHVIDVKCKAHPPYFSYSIIYDIWLLSYVSMYLSLVKWNVIPNAATLYLQSWNMTRQEQECYVKELIVYCLFPS